jgi:hypothetical protein
MPARSAVLPLAEREPLLHLSETPDPDAPLPRGYPVIATFGEQGPAVCGWLPRYHPGIAVGLHLSRRCSGRRKASPSSCSRPALGRWPRSAGTSPRAGPIE